MGREGWLRRLGPWVGIGTSPAALMMGGGVAEGLSGGRLVLALCLGAVLLGTLATVQGLLGQRTGRPLAALTAGPLGVEGSRRTASVVMLLMMLGWMGVNADVAGTALGRLLGIPAGAGVGLFGGLMLAVALRGLGTLSWAALVAGLATAGLAAYGLRLVFSDPANDPTLAGGQTGIDPIGLAPAIALVIGYGAAFSLRTPDFTADLARPRQVLWCALAGLVVPVIAFALAGATLQGATGDWDLADVMRELGSPTVAYLFVSIGFTGSVLTNIWSGALSLADAIPGVGARTGLVATAAAGSALAATGFADLMLGWLTVMALAAPGLVALCAVHVLRGGGARPGWGTIGLASWGAGFGCGLALHMAGSPLALPAAAMVPAVAYLLLGRRGERDLVDATQEG